MKTSTSIQLKILAPLLVIFCTACSPFKASEQSPGGAKHPTGNDYVGLPDTGSPNSNDPGVINPPNNPNNPVIPTPNTPASKSQELAFDVSYAQIHGVTHDRLNEALNRYIRRSNCQNVAPNEYRCGELPFGDIIDSEKKKVLNLAIPATRGADGDISYHVNAASVPIFLSRKQSGSVIDIADLTQKKTLAHFASSGVGDDIFVKLNPQGGKVGISLCMAVPGLKVFAEKTRVTGRVVKDLPIIPDLESDLLIDVNPGWVELKAAKLCSDLLVEIDENNAPKISLQKVHVPKDICAAHFGLVVDVNAQLSGLWSFVNNILKVFRIDLEKIIAAEVKKQVLNLSQNQINVTTETIEDGRWMADLLTHGYLESTVTSFSNKLRDQMAEKGWLDLTSKESLQVACMGALKATGITGLIGQAAFKACALAPKLEFKLLEDDAPMRQMGCYNYYFSITDAIPQNAWWANNCSIKNRVILKADAKLATMYECLAEAWNLQLAPDRICRVEIQNFVTALENGGLDYLFNDPRLQNIQIPTEAQLERLRLLAEEQLGILIPTLAEIKKLFQ